MTHPTQELEGTAVAVFTKNDCRQCDMTKKVLDREGIVYTSVNVEEDATAYNYVTEVLGLRQMPVVVASTPGGDVIWSGLQPTKIREYITHRADAA